MNTEYTKCLLNKEAFLYSPDSLILSPFSLYSVFALGVKWISFWAQPGAYFILRNLTGCAQKIGTETRLQAKRSSNAQIKVKSKK